MTANRPERVQALILAGGEGTRLRPLTSTVPKPVVQLVDRPFISYMIEWLRGHGVDDVILACGFMADGIRSVLGDGSSLGVSLRYVEEPTPLGTGGALKYAEDLLADRFFMLNGDVLTDIDLTAQLRQHESSGARATLALMPVEDPSAYGLVRCGEDWAVREFVEKPEPRSRSTPTSSTPAPTSSSATCSTEWPPAGTRISIEREVFPTLVGHGLYGYEASRLLDGHRDPGAISPGDVRDPGGRRQDRGRTTVAEAGGVLREGEVDGATGVIHAPALVGAGCRLRRARDRRLADGAGPWSDRRRGRAHRQFGRARRRHDRRADHGQRLDHRAATSRIGDHCRVEGRVVLGQDVSVGARQHLVGGDAGLPGRPAT